MFLSALFLATQIQSADAPKVTHHQSAPKDKSMIIDTLNINGYIDDQSLVSLINGNWDQEMDVNMDRNLTSMLKKTEDRENLERNNGEL